MWKVADRTFQAVRQLGSGGCAEVHLVREQGISTQGVEFALKVLKCFTSEEFQRGCNEASLLSSLPCHPHIVRFRGARSSVEKDENGRKYRLLVLLFDYAGGGDLQSRLKPSQELFLEVGTQIGRALEYLHSREPPIIHHDVKMENILYDDKAGCWKLCDFGSARREHHIAQKMAAWELAHLEHALASVTTKAYRPPECIDVYNGTQVVTSKADIWMYGCVLFALCFGRLPFGVDAPVLTVLNRETNLTVEDLQENDWKRHALPVILWCLSPAEERPSIVDCLNYLAGLDKGEEVLTVIPEVVRSRVAAFDR
eukprot:Protomagalhaensia_wolfi_Nauph_80__6124@NODE_883_length_1914_cov_16_918400_g663_i0_p1_GENE_NODE_883_length_1914_cov_16_918400_g663_i0NODE_883_length_1914_cov_16_918400_g663_i0_p1_ORF_typecomplete_len312_score37_94Pkinase/PF00069_25/1_2e44Pkinase_Tyr/PF07714_17/7_6e33Kinaselike/PF14531_6/1_2e10Kdo/PF06293_14/5_4e08Pkinase_fungal/PF17667_1/0_00019APH/PF01636_23/0_0032Seadorna_VP7/PF07387_11/0_034FTA2/PF13095_6/94FTA2/PF13095_6/1_1RIO1/PF01163_22/0_2Choline_kinase/PF01633_20/0_35_NODE_883_length_191